MPHLFVYGTLKYSSTHPMAGFLEARARYIGSATVAGRLFDLGRYPGLSAAETDDDRVYGDVYELLEPETTLLGLDGYEGALYERRIEQVELSSGERIRAWLYWYRGIVDKKQHIVSGKWEIR